MRLSCPFLFTESHARMPCCQACAQGPAPMKFFSKKSPQVLFWPYSKVPTMEEASRTEEKAVCTCSSVRPKVQDRDQKEPSIPLVQTSPRCVCDVVKKGMEDLDQIYLQKRPKMIIVWKRTPVLWKHPLSADKKVTSAKNGDWKRPKRKAD